MQHRLVSMDALNSALFLAHIQVLTPRSCTKAIRKFYFWIIGIGIIWLTCFSWWRLCIVSIFSPVGHTVLAYPTLGKSNLATNARFTFCSFYRHLFTGTVHPAIFLYLLVPKFCATSQILLPVDGPITSCITVKQHSRILPQRIPFVKDFLLRLLLEFILLTTTSIFPCP